MIAGNVVDRFQPFSTIKQVGWHHCIINSSAVLCILYSWFQHIHGFRTGEITISVRVMHLQI